MKGVGSLLTVLGYFLSPEGGVFWVVLLNRALALIVIWTTAVLIHRYQTASKDSKVAEEALRQSEKLLRTVTETTLDAIVMIDHDSKVRYWNPAAEKMFGYTSAEVLGTPLAPLIVPEKYHKALSKGLSYFRETGEGRLLGKTTEMLAKRKDGSEFAIEHAISPVQVGMKWGAVGIMRDITLRKEEIETQFSKLNKTHQRIVQIEKLSAMGLMIGEIAHQINNPLVGVVNMAQLGLREKENPENTRELLKDIRNAGDDCRSFLQNMMEFTKVSCFDRKPTEMKALIEGTIALCQQSTDKARAGQIVFNSPEKSVTLEVDPILIRHALFNLISNAVQADEGGKVIVSLSSQLGNTNNAAGWALSVRDEGPGLPEEIMDKIFTPFFTTRSGGTGLGLPLVQHVAILHEGEITATNHPDGGAEFSIWLPDNTDGIENHG